MNIGIRPSSLAVVTAVLGLLARPPVVDAQWPPPERKAAEKLVTGVFYLRVDAPCDYNRVVPMLDVSPDGADTRRIADLSPQDRDNVEWLFGPNDAVGRFSLRWGITSVRLWGQGMGSSRHEVLIDFVRIKNLDDFKKALELSFSRTPLPDAGRCRVELAPEVAPSAERRPKRRPCVSFWTQLAVCRSRR